MKKSLATEKAKDIKDEYYRIFGHKERPSLFELEELDYASLRKKITEGRYERVGLTALPFERFYSIKRAVVLPQETQKIVEASYVVVDQDVEETISKKRKERLLPIDFYIISKIKSGGYHAHGIFNPNTRHIDLQPGSLISKDVTVSFDQSEDGAKRRAFLKKFCVEKPKHYELKTKVRMHNVTLAASFVIGRKTNGWVKWLTAEGKAMLLYYGTDYTIPS